MLHLPTVQGLIKRRLLVNFRAEPEVVQRILPKGFVPKLYEGNAIVGICLIRLEQMRPSGVSGLPGLSSENAAHRIAVEWGNSEGDAEEGVYIPRRDTDSKLVAMAGGRLFPGEYQHARFHVTDDGDAVSLAMASVDGAVSVKVVGRSGQAIRKGSCFRSLEEASAYFERGCVGYSAVCNSPRLDGIKLETESWEVSPFEVSEVHSSFFEDPTIFPKDSVEFDHALIMREIRHRWRSCGS